MKNEAFQARLNQEILDFIDSRRSLHLATITHEGDPYTSYAPFARGDECLYILISEIAVHALNLQANPRASVMIIEDEDSAGELFARLRVSYQMDAQLQDVESEGWKEGIKVLAQRHGERINNLSQLADFRLFKLVPRKGRYVKGFGKAFDLIGGSLAAEKISHLKDGHKKRSAA